MCNPLILAHLLTRWQIENTAGALTIARRENGTPIFRRTIRSGPWPGAAGTLPSGWTPAGEYVSHSHTLDGNGRIIENGNAEQSALLWNASAIPAFTDVRTRTLHRVNNVNGVLGGNVIRGAHLPNNPGGGADMLQGLKVKIYRAGFGNYTLDFKYTNNGGGTAYWGSPGGMNVANLNAAPLAAGEEFWLEQEFNAALNTWRARAYRKNEAPPEWQGALTGGLAGVYDAFGGMSGIYSDGGQVVSYIAIQSRASFALLPDELGLIATYGAYLQSSGAVVLNGADVQLVSSRPWHTLTLQNGATGTLQYRVQPDGTMMLRGTVTRTSGVNAAVATLPADMTNDYTTQAIRPAVALAFNSNGTATASISTLGVISISAVGAYSFDGLSYDPT